MVTDPIDALYAVSLDAFTAERDALAKRLRKDKDREGAAAVAKLRKPTAAAWMLNQVARQEPATVVALLDATEELRRATESGKGVREAIAAHRDASRAVLAAARGHRPNGKGASDAMVDRIRDVLAAVALDADLAGALRAGRLVADQAEDDAPADSAAAATPAPAQADAPRRRGAAKGGARPDAAKPAPPEDDEPPAGGRGRVKAGEAARAKKAAAAARRAEEEAARRRQALERHLAEAIERLDAARDLAGRAHETASGADARLEEAQRSLARATKEREAARAAVADADAAVDAAAREAEQIRSALRR